MSRRAFGRVAVPVAVLATLAVLGVSYFLVPRNSQDEPDEPEHAVQPSSPGFREEAEKAGITFRMSFLPAEQGANFKINLYDHGCGVAVGDFDGDGHDDVYFINQLGPNKLYRNKGDG